MHYLPDTEDEDAAAERPWPDGFKAVIQSELTPVLEKSINAVTLHNIFQSGYEKWFDDAGELAARVVDIAVIGAEIGVDVGFDMIYQAFLDEKPLPERRLYGRYHWPLRLPRILRQNIRRAIFTDYITDDEFNYAYAAGYSNQYPNLDSFIEAVARIMVCECEKGTDDMLAQIYRAFCAKRPLPPARRNPKQLKQY